MADSKVVIDIIASNTRTFNMLEFVLEQHGKGRFVLSRGNRPDLVVVDFDNSDVQTTFRKFRSRFPDIPAVLLLNRSEEYENLPDQIRIGAEYPLLKPFAAKDFIHKIHECLEGAPAVHSKGNSGIVGEATAHGQAKPGTTAGRIEQEEPSGRKVSYELQRKIAEGAEKTVPLQTSSANQAARPAIRQRSWGALEDENIAYSFANESDIDMADAAAAESLWLNIDTKLLGYLKSAISKQAIAQSAICLSLGDSLSFHISPYARSVAVVGKDVDLLVLAQQDFGNLKISVSESEMPDRAVHPQMEMEAFLWKLALYTYRGYLPQGININKPVYLKCWPNLTRLEPTPSAMRIASLLCRQPAALAFIVRILNIPQKHVFTFFAAANAIGFAGPAVREVDNMLLPSYPDELNDSQVRGSLDRSALQSKSTR